MDSQLRRSILQALHSGPLDKDALSKKLRLPKSQQAALSSLLSKLELQGEIARIRKKRYCLPQEVDLVTGTIRFHPNGSAKLIPTTPGATVLYLSAENTATAMQGDCVVARVKDRPSSRGNLRPEGRVIRILERVNQTIVGTLQKSKQFFYVVADDPHLVHPIMVPAPKSPLQASIGDKVIVSLLPWESRDFHPEGEITEVLGSPGTPGIDMLSIIRKFHLSETLPLAVIEDAQKIPVKISPKEIQRRTDFRRDLIFTIDPDDARDFDDAISLEETEKGWLLSVHIADVSHYVQPKSVMDREALARGNSVYLADRVLPMLPEILSNGICSLVPHEDRLTFSVLMEINGKGKVVRTQFTKGVIRSAHRLTYKEAFAILSAPPKDALSKKLHAVWKLAELLRKRRFENGALDLDFPEIKVWLDAEGKPVRLEKIDNDISHQLIEECMLIANESVARALKLGRQPTIYRVHEKPETDRLNEFRELASTHGFPAGDLNQRPELQRLLKAIKGSKEEYAIKLGLLKSLKRARYDTLPLGHYGLNKTDYTHFTSPIRRYSDLLTHRTLAKWIGWSKDTPSKGELDRDAAHISMTERIATEAERESVQIKKLEFFQMQIADHKEGIFDAVITEVRNYGFFVELPEFLLTGLVHVSSLDNDFYRYDGAKSRFVGKKTRKSYRAGDPIKVIVTRVDIPKRQVDFRPADLK